MSYLQSFILHHISILKFSWKCLDSKTPKFILKSAERKPFFSHLSKCTIYTADSFGTILTNIEKKYQHKRGKSTHLHHNGKKVYRKYGRLCFSDAMKEKKHNLGWRESSLSFRLYKCKCLCRAYLTALSFENAFVNLFSKKCIKYFIIIIRWSLFHRMT